MSKVFSRSAFLAYKNNFLPAINNVLSDEPPRSLDEAAFPAYTHPNPFINWLFWRRLYVVMNDIANHGPYSRVLDFGCGSGILLPFLAKYSQEVLGVDIDLRPYKRMTRYIDFPSHIQVRDSHQTSLNTYPSESFNLITALDVLEHVDDLSETLDQLMRLLKPNGQLIISGPTENVFYKAGRTLAGKEFSGVYHERGVAEISLLARQRGNVQMLTVLFPLFPLFEIFTVKKFDK